MTREQAYDLILETPDAPRAWPLLHENLFQEVAERWTGSPPDFYAHC